MEEDALVAQGSQVAILEEGRRPGAHSVGVGDVDPSDGVCEDGRRRIADSEVELENTPGCRVSQHRELRYDPFLRVGADPAPGLATGFSQEPSALGVVRDQGGARSELAEVDQGAVALPEGMLVEGRIGDMDRVEQ